MPILVFASALILYILTLSPTISVGDSPELISSAYLLGISHPPGYPLFSLLGGLMSFIPFSDHIAYRVNLASAVMGSLATLFIYLSILEAIGLIRVYRGWPVNRENLLIPLADRLSAFIGSLILALSPIFWSQAVIAEVYTMNTAFFAGLLWVGLKWAQIQGAGVRGRGSRFLYLIAFLWGLSLGNHHTMIAFGPAFFLFAGIYWFAEARRLGSLIRPCISLVTRRSSLITIFFFLGLSTYLYLPIRSAENPFMDWGDAERLNGFLEVLLRKQFGLGSRDYSLERAVMQTGYYLTLLREQFTFPGLILGGIGLSFFIGRDLPASLFTLVLFLIHGIITIIFLNPAHTDLNEIDVMIIPSFVIFSLWVGIGLLFVYKGIAAIYTKGLAERRERNIVIAITLIYLMIPAILLYTNLHKNNQKKNTFAYDYAGDIFGAIEPNGVLFVDSDLSLFPLWYMQYVEGKRRDVAVLDVDMLMLPWFKKQLRDKYPAVEIRVPDVIRHSKGKGFKPLSMEAIVSYKVSQVEEMLDDLMGKHPVYLSYDFGIPFKEFGERKDIHIIQKGITFRVLKEAAADEFISKSPTLKSILKEIESGEEEVLFISRGYVSAMEVSASIELASGHKNSAMKWMEGILKVAPYNASSLNILAFLYAEEGRKLLKAEQMAKKALFLNPRERSRYLKTLGYIYLKKGKYLEAREAFMKVLEMEPDSEWTRRRMEETYSKTSP